jgi:hypothetical protein
MKTRIQTFFPFLAFFILGGAVYLTMALISPLAPLPVDAPAAEFSAGRAMLDLEIIAREPHPMGVSQAHAEVRDFLLSEIRKLGLEPRVQDAFATRVLDPGHILGGFVQNILVRLPGDNPQGAILLMAHYDSTPGGPGAADNGSGTVVILEILRALQAGPVMRQDVILFFTDGEEPGTLGAHAFVAQHPWLEDVRLVINLDTITDAPPVFTRTSTGDGLWIQALAHSVRRPFFTSMPFHLFPASDTDIVPFTDAGVPAADFAAARKFAEMHTSADLPEVVNPASVQQTGEQLLALVRYLGDQTTFEMSVPNQTFFPMFGVLVHYPSSWGLPLAILAGLCFLGALIFGFLKRELTWHGLGFGFLAFLLSLALSVGIVSILWAGIQVLHPGYQYSSSRAHLSDDYLYMLGFTVLSLAFMTAVIALARKKISALDLVGGSLLIWLPGSIAAAIVVPATSYFFTWVLLSESLALLLAIRWGAAPTGFRRHLGTLGFFASASLATFLWIPPIYVGFLGASFPMLWLVIGGIALWIGAMLPALDWITSTKRWLLPAAAFFVSLGFLLAGHFMVGKNTPPPKINAIGYWLDADSRQAYWVAFISEMQTDARSATQVQTSFPDQMDERQNYLLPNPVRRPYTDLFPQALQFPILTDQAPLLAVDGPRLEVIQDEWGNDRRLVKIGITSSLHDRVYIIIMSESPLLAVNFPGSERTGVPDDSGKRLWMRIDGVPSEGVQLIFEFRSTSFIQFLIVEEKAVLPSFPGLFTQPEPGRMESPGDLYQGVPADFTAIYRNFEIP